MDLKEALDSIREAPYVTGSKPKDHFHPSSASVKTKDKDGREVVYGTCLRRQYYEYLDFPIVGRTSARMSRILEMGDKYAQMFLEDFKRLGIYVADEVSFFIPEINVSGRIDALIKDPYKAPKPPLRPAPQDLIGVEFKTVGGYQGVKGPVISTKEVSLCPKYENVLQVMIYLDYYGKWGVNRWILLYIDRALGSGEESPKHYEMHYITLDDNGAPVIQNESGLTVWKNITLKMVYDRFKTLDKAIKSRELPDRDFCLQFTNTQIKQMFDLGELNQAESKKVGKYLKKTEKVSDEDPPIITIGDWQCMRCPFTSTCYSDSPNIPLSAKPITPEVTQEVTQGVEDFV